MRFLFQITAAPLSYCTNFVNELSDSTFSCGFVKPFVKTFSPNKIAFSSNILVCSSFSDVENRPFADCDSITERQPHNEASFTNIYSKYIKVWDIDILIYIIIHIFFPPSNFTSIFISRERFSTNIVIISRVQRFCTFLCLAMQSAKFWSEENACNFPKQACNCPYFWCSTVQKLDATFYKILVRVIFIETEFISKPKKSIFCVG